jgi:hypothetical protein
LTTPEAWRIVVYDESRPGYFTDRKENKAKMLFRKPTRAKVTIKLFSGINRDLGLSDYDPSRGIELEVREGVRLKKVLKGLGMRKLMHNAYFQNGERAGLWTRLRNGDEISCIKPSAGG